MNSLMSYGSDGENSSDSDDAKTTSTISKASLGAKKTIDAIYDPVPMDMSEESNSNDSANSGNRSTRNNKSRVSDSLKKEGSKNSVPTLDLRRTCNEERSSSSHEKEHIKHKSDEHKVDKYEKNSKHSSDKRSGDKKRDHKDNKDSKRHKDNDKKSRDDEKKSRDSDKRKEKSSKDDEKSERDHHHRDARKDRDKRDDKDKQRDRGRDKERDKGKDKCRDRSSRDKSRERQSKDKSRDRSSKDKSRDRSSRDKSRERERDKDRRHRDDRSRHRENRRSKDRGRSRSRSRSRDKSHRPLTFREERGKNKLAQLEKLGIEIKATDEALQTAQEFYNPLTTATQGKYAEQIQKRKLLWQNKKQDDNKTAITPSSTTSTWVGTTFTHDQDGKVTAKFKRLMGIKDNTPILPTGVKPDILKKQEEMFNNMEQQYEVARATTHTQRGVGLGYGSGFMFPR
ncbi:arginine/serine-rich coiled-coil protein 2 [Copidosoma floridanum]|uniref:arginine/serine-rich coiled-coil protein 2 n=1 Tax=Copidosoma floridanum TaxID=29053 RepID=UPI0006C969C9|nr:arginine/serine-rich coiled-coil protein 2 [Copidosoma floridanum]